MKKMMLEEFCLDEEVQTMEDELRSLKLRDTNIDAYTQRFHELVLLSPKAVPTEKKKVEAYIKGLPENIKGKMTSPRQKGFPRETKENGKIHSVAIGTTTPEETIKATTATNNTITRACHNCERPGHFAIDCRRRSTPVCYECGEKGHTRNYCSKKKNPQGEEARGRAYVIKELDKDQGPNVVMDPVRLNTSYEVELADGRVASTNVVLKGCTINLVGHLFKIDFMPIELGTFNVIIGMDWLVEQDAVIVCGKKVVHVPYKNKTLVVEGDRGASRLKVISCIKARKFIERGSQLFVAHVTEKEPQEK
nr:hypothetical protein [Tanacetum cinerariifolium]